MAPSAHDSRFSASATRWRRWRSVAGDVLELVERAVERRLRAARRAAGGRRRSVRMAASTRWAAARRVTAAATQGGQAPISASTRTVTAITTAGRPGRRVSCGAPAPTSSGRAPAARPPVVEVDAGDGRDGHVARRHEGGVAVRAAARPGSAAAPSAAGRAVVGRLDDRRADGAERRQRGGPRPGQVARARRSGTLRLRTVPGRGQQPVERRAAAGRRCPVAGRRAGARWLGRRVVPSSERSPVSTTSIDAASPSATRTAVPGRGSTPRRCSPPGPGTPKLAAVRAAPTVPEWSTARPVLQPGLMPDTTTSGGSPKPPRRAASTHRPGGAVDGVGRDAGAARAARPAGRRCARRGGCGRWRRRSRSCPGRAPPPRLVAVVDQRPDQGVQSGGATPSSLVTRTVIPATRCGPPGGRPSPGHIWPAPEAVRGATGSHRTSAARWAGSPVMR